MEAVVVVAPLERVAAAAVDVEPGAAGDEEPQPLAVLVELALEPTLPATPLVKLVQHHERVPPGQRAARISRRSSRLSQLRYAPDSHGRGRDARAWSCRPAAVRRGRPSCPPGRHGRSARGTAGDPPTYYAQRQIMSQLILPKGTFCRAPSPRPSKLLAERREQGEPSLLAQLGPVRAFEERTLLCEGEARAVALGHDLDGGERRGDAPVLRRPSCRRARCGGRARCPGRRCRCGTPCPREARRAARGCP